MLNLNTFYIIYAGIIGAFIGSFANVVIYRLPKGKSIIRPRSSCPNCNRTLSVIDLVPIFSWLFLRGRCRSCKEPISFRYPLIEILMALGFSLIVWQFPITSYQLSFLPLITLFAMIVIMSAIDIDHYILPDSLTLPALVVGILGTFLYIHSQELELPYLMQALQGAALGAGIITLINRVGSLVLRRFHDTKERLWPIGMDQVNLAALGGVLGGWWLGFALPTLSLIINLISRKVLRLSENILYALWLIALLALPWNPIIMPLLALKVTFIATGAFAIIGAFYWWVYTFYDQGDLATEKDNTDCDNTDTDEPVAMGFGDAKLAAVLGAMLGLENILVALIIAIFAGAILGIIGKFFGGSRKIPFGPYLAFGGLVALFIGSALKQWYFEMIGL